MFLFHLRESHVLRSLLMLVVLGLFSLTSAAIAADPAARQNRLLTVVADASGAVPMVKLTAEKALGYRYTIYDSADPVRVVVDMPGMDISALAPQQMVGSELLKEIKVSSFALTSGTLGRVELLLSRTAEYNVEVADSEMRIVFTGKESVDQKSQAATPISSVPVAATPVSETETAVTSVPVAPVAQQNVGPAKYLMGINILPGSALLQTDGTVGKLKHFTLKSPNRLVIDLYGVKPSFKERSFTPGEGFDKVRIGIYPDKIRLVFDAGKKKLPSNWVESFANVVQVSWGKKKDTPPMPVMAGESVPSEAVTGSAPLSPQRSDGKVVVENVEFKVDGGKSLVLVTLSAAGEITTPVVDGDLIRFDVKNAEVSRGLRRVIDTMSFPSAVRQVTPYLVREGKRQDVRFAVQVKGVVPFELKSEGTMATLLIDNQGFTEVTPEAKETRELPLPENADPLTQLSATDELPRGEVLSVPPVSASAAASPVVTSATAGKLGTKSYNGQKITLVFDSADIRNILQLIAEVSDMNIIASDDVKGNITLRLVDVPWDQALDLILDIKGLGMLEEGNVIRIMPAKDMRALKLERLKDQAAMEDVEPTVTKIFSVQYAPVADIAAKIQAHLGKSGDSGQNSVTSDNRTRQVIVSARPSKLLEIEENILAKLDMPERQVMIEARIVEASDTFSRDLGVKWGVSYDSPSNNAGSGKISAVDASGGGGFVLSPGITTGAGLATGITFGRLGVDTTVLDLRISALETSGSGRVVSTPRVTTLNGAEASITQGTEIPYQSSDDTGNLKTEFKNAELSLKVTPVINPGNSLILDIDAKNDSIGSYVNTGSGSAPAIDRKSAKTRVLVQDGETTVIGGIFIETSDTGIAGVPLLKDIPLLGHLFKSTSVSKRKSELLIFITPRILE